MASVGREHPSFESVQAARGCTRSFAGRAIRGLAEKKKRIAPHPADVDEKPPLSRGACSALKRVRFNAVHVPRSTAARAADFVAAAS